MASRDRIHQSPIHRRRGPTHTHDYPVAGGGKRRAEDGLVSPEYGRDNQRRSSRPDDSDVEQNRYAPQIGRKRLGPGDYYRESYWDAPEYREGRPYNNYDGYDSVYPPAQ